MIRPLAILAVLLAAAGIGYWWMARGGAPAQTGFQGYVEGNLVYMATEEGGRIETMTVEAGDAVQPGQLLFGLDAAVQEAQRAEAEARLEQAKAQLADLKSAMQRPEQIAVLRAAAERARAALDLSRAELDRQKTLFARGYSAQARLDEARSAFDRDTAAVAEAERQIEAAELVGRSAEITAAEAAVRAAESALRQAETRLAKRKVFAPAAARVQDVYFRPGEVVSAGQPVVGLLPPANFRFRFYVPEPMLSTLSLGQPVRISCDRCPPNLTASVSFISHEAEYTPPVIFSEQERAKLVFRAEARPAAELRLPLGLPVSVAPAATGS